MSATIAYGPRIEAASVPRSIAWSAPTVISNVKISAASMTDTTAVIPAATGNGSGRRSASSSG